MQRVFSPYYTHNCVFHHGLQGKMLLPGVAAQEADVEAHRIWKCAFAPPGNNRAANLMVCNRA